jgi:lipopolysaccharide exporter
MGAIPDALAICYYFQGDLKTLLTTKKAAANSLPNGVPSALGNSNATQTAPSGVIKFSRAVKKHSFARDVIKLATGTALAQLIGIIAAPVIARLFAPSAFGALAVFAAVAGPISLIACFRYELAIPLPERDEDASHLVWLCFLLILLTTAITALVLLVAGHQIWRILKVPALDSIGWLIPVNVFFAGLFSVLTAWNTRNKEFSRLMALHIATRVAITGTQILVAFAGYASAGALVISTVLGTVTPTVILAIQTWRDSSHLFLAGLSWQPVLSLVKRYCRFPRYSVGAGFLNSVSQHLPATLLSAFFSVAVAGQFAFGSRLLRLPTALVGSNFSQAFFPRAAEARLAGTLGTLVELALIYLIKLTAFPCLLLTLIGKDVFVVFLGSRWAEAGVYSQILSAWLFTWFLSSPLDTVFVVLEEQGLELRFQAVNVVARFAAIFSGGLLGSARLAVVLFTIAGVLVYGSYSAAVVIKSRARALVIVKPLLSTFALFLPALGIIQLLRYYSASETTVLGVAAVLLVAYFSNLFRAEPAVRGFMLELRHKLSLAGSE